MVKLIHNKMRITKSKKRSSVMELSPTGLLPLFIITVCIVFSFVFTVMIAPLSEIATDIKMIFIMMLVVSTTVASAVSLMFYIFFSNNR